MKYYISSGDQDVIVCAKQPQAAVKHFISNLPRKVKLGALIKVSEVGFGFDGSEHDKDIIYSTEQVLEGKI